MATYVRDNIWSILIGINYILVIILSVFIVLKNRNPVKTLSYVFALIVFPFLGLLGYYFFGQDYRKDKIFDKKYINDNSRLKRWQKKFSLNSAEREDLEEVFGEGIAKIYRLLRNNDKAVLTFDNEVDILINGEAKFKLLREDLNNAKHHIHLEYFVLFDNGLGTQIIDILCKKAEEGVIVRLIYDDVGSNISTKNKKKLTKSGVQHFAFMPVLFSNSTSKLNYRDHRKIVVIDGDIGYVGGINLDQKYDNSFQNDRYWRDTHLRITGGAVGALQSSFILSWNFAAKEELDIEEILLPKHKAEPKKPVAIQIAASGPDSDWANIMEAMFCAINTAKKSILITTPYFMPNAAILTALTTAARSGVEVKVIIPYESDSWAAQYASDSYIEECLNSGIIIFRYCKGFIHAKTFVIDEMFSSIGTANLDYRSFSLNFEINALIYNKTVNEQMRKQFELDIADCEEVTLDRWINRGIGRKLKESFSRLWAPLL
ncbi:cardiolipin synthase [Arenibacter sp. BSSL-BM3]|uniref:Cardiolipin synthase n=1 Tax=Arenibacter arenosicollis TaxID=2762274 RepID=A0ABR7QMX4_9FLAO|nr:cardiolipin synthase [Arenibacter arenosicollis]MBC8768508.1 cardiolipin synthase [Arenibacter arenosicollis]